MTKLIKNYLMVMLLVIMHPIAFAKGKLPETVKRERFAYDTVDINVLLNSIASLETDGGRNMNSITGEKTIYQITREVWEQHTDILWGRAGLSPIIDKSIAVAHLNWIIKHLDWTVNNSNDKPRAQVECIFNAWHYGLSRAYTGTTDYATRGANLYYDLVEL